MVEESIVATGKGSAAEKMIENHRGILNGMMISGPTRYEWTYAKTLFYYSGDGRA